MSPHHTPVIAAPPNFRDLADPVHPRTALRRRLLFRSDHLGSLQVHEARQIQDLGIRRVIDFRGEHERRSAACAVPGVQVHSLAIEPTIVQVLSELTAAGQAISALDVAGHMEETYRGFVRQSSAQFAQFFDLLLATDEPTVFHCTAGKDRTGFAAALVLHALGASREDVMTDYMLTNERLQLPPGMAQSMGLTSEVASVLWSVQAEFLEAAFQAIESDFGTLDTYLHQALGLVDSRREQLRSLYLQA